MKVEVLHVILVETLISCFNPTVEVGFNIVLNIWINYDLPFRSFCVSLKQISAILQDVHIHVTKYQYLIF